MRNWRVDFFALWTVQFVAALGFGVAGPFVPLYIQQDLGVSGMREAAMWSGIMGALGGITLAVSSPVWGVLADRYGRKLMVVRATMGASFFQAAMGLVANVQQLVLMRALMSLVSGVQAACMALASTVVPKAQLGFALGSLQTANALGSTVGPMVGGLMAAALGFRPTFFATGLVLFLAGLLTALVVHEDFTPPPKTDERPRALASFQEVLGVRRIPELMAVVMVARAAGAAMATTIPLALQGMAGGDPNVTAQAGTVVGLTALAMATGALFWGRLGDRHGQAPTMLACILISIVAIVPQVFVRTPWQLAIGQMVYTFALAGMMPTATALMGLWGPPGRAGVVYGASGTALAIGNAVGPTMAAVVIGLFGIPAMFLAVGVMLGVLFVVARRLADGSPRPAQAG